MSSHRRAKGEGTILRRQDGRYEGRLSYGNVDGKRRRASVYGVTKKEVADKLRKIRVKFGRNVSDLAIGEHLERWLEDGMSRWQPQTYRTYRALIRNHIIPLLGSRKIFEIEPADVRVWMRRLEDENIGAPARKRSLSILRSALKQLVDDWQLERNPCDPVRGPKLEKLPVQIPSVESVKKLLEAAEPLWLFTLVLLALACAMREGEIFALHWTQVDLDVGNICVDRSLADDWNGKPVRKSPKNKMSARTLFLPSITIGALRRLTCEQRFRGYEGPWVFPDAIGGPLRKSNFMRREWRPLLEKAKLGYFKFHALRHWSNSVLPSVSMMGEAS